jgi:Uma2 family endonuclease
MERFMQSSTSVSEQFIYDADEIFYPETDGQPMAENTQQFELITMLHGGIDAMFHDRDDVFVAGDLFWYPIEGKPSIRLAPDVMVVFGRPRGHRASYMQWKEENIAPQVVFEIVSPSNRPSEMMDKLDFYDTYGVEEYFMYDPSILDLKSWRRTDGYLKILHDDERWHSHRLQVSLRVEDGKLIIIRNDTKQRFEVFREVFLRAEQEKRRAEQEKQRADQAQHRAEVLAAKLRSLGISPDDVL